ncbi:MAG: long-chain fatty acid--CoA ligase, partial [Bacillota bacterium]
IVERKKDMIISGGENVYTQEVENVLCAYEKISEAAVIGVPDEIYGEVIKAVVVPKPGVTITEQEVIAFCRERLAGFKRPRSVVFVDSLPMSGANKVMKRVLRERYGKVGESTN